MLTSMQSPLLKRAFVMCQAPPSLDEDNFPSLANSPSPSPRASHNGPTQATGAAPATAAEEGNTAVAASNNSESPKAAPAKAPSAWGTVDGAAHKATATPEKKSNAVWKSEFMSSQQKAQAANSKLQPGAASFKAKNKGTGKVPWVETGETAQMAHGLVQRIMLSYLDRVYWLSFCDQHQSKKMLNSVLQIWSDDPAGPSLGAHDN